MIEVLLRSGEGRKVQSVEIRFNNIVTINGQEVTVGDRYVSVKGMRVR